MFGRDPKFLKHDLTTAAHFAAPETTFAALRAAGPLAPTRLPFIGNTFMTTTYAASTEMLKNPDLFVRQPERAGLKPTAHFTWWMPKTLHHLADNMMAKDDPDHRRLRSTVDHAFARRDIASMEPDLRKTASALLDKTNAGQSLDIMAHYSREIPFLAICDLLGLTQSDAAKARRMTDGISNMTGLLSFLTAMPGLSAFRKFLDAKFRANDTPPAQGLRGLLQTPKARETLSRSEQVAMIFLLFVGGHETTVHLINGTIVILAQNPSLKQQIIANPAHLPLFIEEVLRHLAPVQMTKPRFVTQDTTFHGQSLKRGDQVAAHIGCSNRDPAKYNDPDVFDPSRKPNPHLGFSSGPHFCLGLMLARLETRIALETLFNRYPNLEISAETLPWRSRLGMRALTSLPVKLG